MRLRNDTHRVGISPGGSDDAEPLPTDGMEVEEFHDADTARLFMLEWRRRMRRALPDQPAGMRHEPRPGGMMGA